MDGGHRAATIDPYDADAPMTAEPAASPFASAAEFREVMDAAFELMRDDPDIGPRLRAGDVPQRYVIEDLDLVFHIRSGGAEEPHIVWTWDAAQAWPCEVELLMRSEVANRYFQGRENMPVAVARRRIAASGNVKAALALMPLTRPLFARYRDMLAERWPHLVV
jgi:hypothetical protein